MSKEKKPTKSTTTTTKVKRPVGRPKKSAALGVSTQQAMKNVRKLADGAKAYGVPSTREKATITKVKKPSEKAQATRELNKAVKGTHARPSTTPATANLYDTKAAFELLQSQINAIRRKSISLHGDIKTALKAADDQVHTLLGDIEDVQGKLNKQVEAYNSEVRKPVDAAVEAKKPWYKKLRGGRA